MSESTRAIASFVHYPIRRTGLRSSSTGRETSSSLLSSTTKRSRLLPSATGRTTRRRSSIGIFCETCSEFVFYDLNEHRQEERHKEAEKVVKPMIRKCAKLLHLQCRMRDLGSIHWQKHLSYCLMQDFTDSSKDLWYCEALLQKYEHKERMALLELAAWKVSCLVNQQPLDYLTWRDFIQEGWKSTKNEMRSSNSIDIIVSCVSPFLAPTMPLTWFPRNVTK